LCALQTAYAGSRRHTAKARRSIIVMLQVLLSALVVRVIRTIARG
jgi:hypothetical protein